MLFQARTPLARTSIVPPLPPLPQAAAPRKPIRRIAVCDDDIRFIRYVERALACADVAMTPVTTLDLDEAVRVLAASGCDAALVDLCMYDDRHAGFRLVERIRACAPTASLPLFLATGDVREAMRHQDLLQAHHCELLAKPFGPEELMSTIGITTRMFAA